MGIKLRAPETTSFAIIVVVMAAAVVVTALANDVGIVVRWLPRQWLRALAVKQQ